MSYTYVLDLSDRPMNFKKDLSRILDQHTTDIDKYYYNIVYKIIDGISDTNGSDPDFYKTVLKDITTSIFTTEINKELTKKITDLALCIYFTLQHNRILKDFSGMLSSVSNSLLLITIFEEENVNV